MYSYTFYRISQYVILHNLVMLSIFHYFFFILLAFLLFFPVSIVAFSISILYNKYGCNETAFTAILVLYLILCNFTCNALGSISFLPY